MLENGEKAEVKLGGLKKRRDIGLDLNHKRSAIRRTRVCLVGMMYEPSRIGISILETIYINFRDSILFNGSNIFINIHLI